MGVSFVAKERVRGEKVAAEWDGKALGAED
jgi:hypothetical protein